MTLQPGATLGAYRITAQIGVGGMGEVYRASDARLGRDVAIKVLPTEWVADHDRMARFHRKAQVLASLNHPHIAASGPRRTGRPSRPRARPSIGVPTSGRLA